MVSGGSHSDPTLWGFGPWRVRSAAQIAAFVCAGSAVVNLVVTMTDANGPQATNLLIAVWTLGVAAAFLLVPRFWQALMFLVMPLVGATSVLTQALAAHEFGPAQYFAFCLNALAAASELRVRGAALVVVVILGAESVAVTQIVPQDEVVPTLGYLAALQILMCALLVRARWVNHRLIDRLEHQAAIDPLTGLFTRHVLDAAAAAAIHSVDADAGTAFILLDLDHFKSINDEHGHPAGDAALQHVANTLRKIARSDDVVARMGGDEVAILLPSCSYDSALSRAEQFVAAIGGLPVVLPDGTTVALSVSAGVAHLPEHAVDVPGLYAMADAALYAAKRAGRNRASGVPEWAVAP
jgi:diguanylate cyclase (GGDEF)-like protein